MVLEHDQRTASGVPPAPVLTLPTIYKGQKGNNTNKQPPFRSNAATQSHNATTGRLPPDIHDFILGIQDLRPLSRPKRERLLEGPSVQIKLNHERVANFPLRVLLAASQKARIIYLSVPNQPLTEINLSVATSKDPRPFKTAIKDIIDYLKSTCTKNRAYWFVQRTLGLDAYLLAAAYLLDMEDYFSHFDYRKALHRDPLSLTTLLVIENAAPSPDFRIFASLVDRLSNELISGARSTQDAQFLAWMRACPNISRELKLKYEAKRAVHSSKQAAKAQKRDEKAELKAIEEMARLRLAEQHAMGKQERASRRGTPEPEDREDQLEAMRARALRTINAGGVNTMSAEEAALVPRRGGGA